ncbi:YdcF family protein [Falsiroseomonas selenitidurans]|uniref:YdcF family protein n=1 Tax=Falsiroseomonas selenitidurans TaxID=2716335 RepID=A0ABX1E951_9PROT|nr:YdcF family protein [Falsiroseomonas selenitidurans]NKC31435.1 YdcF family protein [Falsiroseomonas selenitidurans]
MKRLVSAGVALALLALLALGWGFVQFLAVAEAPPAETGLRTDAIVVLTGGRDRVETALGLLDSRLAPRLLVSGAHAELTLAELARAHGRDPAALAGRVTLGRAAATTLGNAAEVAAWTQAGPVRSIRLVTAGYHMPRALLELRRAAPGLAVVPHPVMPSLLREAPGRGRGLPGLRRWTLLSGEYLKYVAAAAGLTRFLPAKESARR